MNTIYSFLCRKLLINKKNVLLGSTRRPIWEENKMLEMAALEQSEKH